LGVRSKTALRVNGQLVGLDLEILPFLLCQEPRLLLLMTLLVPFPADAADAGAVNDVLARARVHTGSDYSFAVVVFVIVVFVLPHFFSNGSKRSRPAIFFVLGVLGAIFIAIFVVDRSPGFLSFPFVRPLRGRLAPAASCVAVPAAGTSLVAVKELLRGKKTPWDETSAAATDRISCTGDNKCRPDVDGNTGDY
jgi:hypothetical protein